jgi:hypothetical protein
MLEHNTGLTDTAELKLGLPVCLFKLRDADYSGKLTAERTGETGQCWYLYTRVDLHGLRQNHQYSIGTGSNVRIPEVGTPMALARSAMGIETKEATSRYTKKPSFASPA